MNTWFKDAPFISPGFSTWFKDAPFAPPGIFVGQIGGTATITFNADGSTLTGIGKLEGTTGIVFGSQGTLSDATSYIAGTASITFGNVATLTGTGRLAGTATIVFGGQGTLHDATPAVTNFIYNRCSPERMGIRRLNIPVDPWKYRRVSPRNQRVYHIG